jgi:hypothetical protein
MDGKGMSAKWAKHMCWNAARKTLKTDISMYKTTAANGWKEMIDR